MKLFKLILSFTSFAFLLSILSSIYLSIKNPELKWDWEKINTENMFFPMEFSWGTATAAHQVEGNNTNNNWYQWEYSVDEYGKSRIHDNQKSGFSVDHWNRYPNDIKLMKDLGTSHYRFSIEWSRIEPSKGFIDQDALDHYRLICNELIKNNITPVVTLHHFTHPIWFEKMGSFEKKENIQYFISYSDTVFKFLNDLVPIWCTINEPAVFVSQGYFNGVFPPGKKDPKLAAIVLGNILDSHVELYRHLKSTPAGKKSKIGIVKNIFQFEPYQRWNIMDWAVSGMLDSVFNSSIINFFKTGNFDFHLPLQAKLSFKNTEAISSMDFIGLNYYSHYLVSARPDLKEPFVFIQRPDEIQTDMDYSIYPEGFYRALHTIKQLDVPIYVTENGIADKEDTRRSLFIERYIYAMYKAMREGVDVRGYFYWTLMDNFEWAEGYDKKFGLYSVNFDNQERTLRKGSNSFKKIINQPGVYDRDYLVRVGETAPELSLDLISGEKINLSDLRGNVVVLQFTASWCSVCRKEMPHLEKDIWQRFKDKNLMLIGIDRDEPIEIVKKFKKETGVTYPMALDPEAEHFSKFAPKEAGVTRNIVIDKNGKIVFLTRLFDKDEYNQMIRVIEKLL